MTEQSNVSAFTDDEENRQSKLTGADSNVTVGYGDATSFYDDWEPPTTIIVDAPDSEADQPPNPETIRNWYRPHLQAWSENATPRTTLWFWGINYDWATIHPELENMGWRYEECNIWQRDESILPPHEDTTRHPRVTEVCARYVREERIHDPKTGGKHSLSEWIANEWARTGLSTRVIESEMDVDANYDALLSSETNQLPHGDALTAIIECANTHGSETHAPYFELDGGILTESRWESYFPVFDRDADVTNHWVGEVTGENRISDGKTESGRSQKPLELMRRLVDVSSAAGDMVWVPFAGTGEAVVASKSLGRKCRSSDWRRYLYDQAYSWVDSIQFGRGGDDTQVTFGTFE